MAICLVSLGDGAISLGWCRLWLVKKLIPKLALELVKRIFRKYRSQLKVTLQFAAKVFLIIC
jgi:hypothetical protein